MSHCPAWEIFFSLAASNIPQQPVQDYKNDDRTETSAAPFVRAITCKQSSQPVSHSVFF
jgi:hypothetical protein